MTMTDSPTAGLSLLSRLMRFAIVGVSCFLVQLTLLLLLDDILHLYIADVLAFIISAQLNFALSQAFTWADRRQSERMLVQWLKFNASALVSVVAVNASVFWLLAEAGLPIWLAMLCANAASTMWTFLMNHLFVFKKEQPRTSTQIPERTDMHILPLADTGASPSVALFMPAFNEASNLPKVVAKAFDFFDRAAITERSVIIVDDGSSDDTAAVLAEIQRSYPVVVVTHETNHGYGRALRSGFTAALATGHDWVAYCDSDGQFNPGDLAVLMVAAFSHQVDVALGIRVKRADNLARRLAGRGWHGVSRLALKFAAADVDCGFKLMHRTAVAAVSDQLQSDFAAISPELLARLHQQGHRFVEVPVPHYPRAGGTQSGLQPKVIVRSFMDLYTVRRDLAAHRSTVPEAIAPAPVLPLFGSEAI
jgi:putative flippase GtrA